MLVVFIARVRKHEKRTVEIMGAKMDSLSSDTLACFVDSRALLREIIALFLLLVKRYKISRGPNLFVIHFWKIATRSTQRILKNFPQQSVGRCC